MRYCTLLLALLSINFIQAQGLPRYMTEEEKAMLPNYSPPQFLSAPPSGSEIRNMAEWEEQQALMLTWTAYPGILAEIVRNAKLEARVIIICSDSTQVKNYLSSKNITHSNIDFLEESYNTIWSRDYGPNIIYTAGVDSMAIVDWIYNRPRPLDDVIPSAIATHLGVPIHSMTSSGDDLVHTGGNYMSDGFGTGFSSRLIVTENGPAGNFNVTIKTEQDIRDLMEEYMAIDEYALMTVLPYDGIHHIDMHMKLLDEETLLVGEYPTGTLDGPQIEANLQYVLNNFTTKYGTPFKVVRIPMPPNNGSGGYSQWSPYMTYANSIFVNNTILIPTYYEQYDTVAQRIYEKALPGYKVIGINCNPIIPSGGALHCITHELGVEDPLLISYKKLEDTLVSPGTTSLNLPIEAEIRHRSGISNAQLFWSADTSMGYNAISMSQIGMSDNYTATIPLANPNGKIYYYVQASSVSGKVMARPMPGASGPNNFEVLSNVGMNEPAIENIDVFPNPASAISCVKLRVNRPGPLKVALYNLRGELIQNVYEGYSKLGEQHYFLQAAELTSGVYILHLRTISGTYTERLVVHH
jgi:agmatine/peptidylarginine deiminase